jgi:hypothetical protein
MTIIHKLIGAALVASAPFATPAFAEPVIDNPGNYAFFYPNADVLNPSLPADTMAARVLPDSLGGLRMSVQPRHPRHAPPYR